MGITYQRHHGLERFGSVGSLDPTLTRRLSP